jgi:hypothetical protein
MAPIVIALVADHTPKNQLRGSYLKNRIIFAMGGALPRVGCRRGRLNEFVHGDREF